MDDLNFNTFNSYQKPKRPKKYGISVIIVACVLSALIGAFSAAVTFFTLDTYNIVDDKSQTEATGIKTSNISINVDEQVSSVVEAVAEKVTPSVVGIRTTTSVTSFFGNQESSGEGSGVIYKEDGYIITNYHVISDATTGTNSKIEVFLGSDVNSQSYEASVVGYNISSDLAIIKINAQNLPAIEVANSEELKVGQYVITVGNPGGLEFMDSVTYGVVSGVNRYVSTDSDVALIQTDAAINPGNSGGALVNTKGELVGINSSKIVSEEFEGMGFAIPSNTVVEICDRIIEKENSPEAYIGISFSEKFTAELLELYGYPKGAVISSVVEGGPAYQAGLRRGDIITKFNGVEISDYSEFEKIFEEVTPNQTVKVELYRNGKNYSTNMTIGSNNSVE